ncbi:hypothetical protein OIU77_009350 [Salix suchowensis]|uniref:Uncharacterized protein n=1 Tax=Salix suchowensis TaxID=1278906 RepID=A0ABQ9AE09_9ROSI|nr:hypothetical protein OIU77_009350 [Salix suchowensis]
MLGSWCRSARPNYCCQLQSLKGNGFLVKLRKEVVCTLSQALRLCMLWAGLAGIDNSIDGIRVFYAGKPWIACKRLDRSLTKMALSGINESIVAELF